MLVSKVAGRNSVGSVATGVQKSLDMEGERARER